MNYKLISLILSTTFVLSGCGSQEPAANAASQCGDEDGIYVIENSWTKPARGGQPVSAAYVTLCNGSAEDDAIVSVAYDGAKAVEIHRSEMTNGVMEMKKLDQLDLPAGQKMQMEPGGTHLMLIGIEEAIEAGETISLRLEFENNAPTQIMLDVRDGAAEDHSGH